MPRSKEQYQEIREKTKKLIMDSALKLFAEKGFNGTSISDIAISADISKGLIYNYFESKTSIAEAIYGQIINEFNSIMLPIYDIEDPFDKLHKIITDTIKYTNEKKDYWRMYISFILQPAPTTFEEVFSPQFFQKFFLEFEEIFKTAGAKDPKHEAYEFAALLDGIQMHMIFMDNLYPLLDMHKHILKKYSRQEMTKRNII